MNNTKDIDIKLGSIIFYIAQMQGLKFESDIYECHIYNTVKVKDY